MRRAALSTAAADAALTVLLPVAASAAPCLVRCSSPPLHRRVSSSPAPPFPLPPPEWVDPFLDLSDVATTPSPGGEHRLPSPWLARVAALLRDSSSPESDLDDYCRRFLIRLSPAFISQALRNPDIRARPDTALRLFRWAARQRHYGQHRLDSYVVLVDIYSSASSSLPPRDREAAVRQLLSELHGLPLTAPACSSLIKSLGAMGMAEELLWVWRRMKESGAELTVWTYNCLLGGLVNASFLAAALKVFDVMRSGDKPGIRPDVISFNLMIKGHCRAGDTGAAMALLAEMEGAGDNPPPDKITYMMLIQAHYAAGDSGGSLRLYQEMEERGLEVPGHAYTLVVAGLCRAGKPFEAAAVLERMAARGVKGNVAVYTALMDAFAKVGNERRAVELLERMKEEGIEPDEVTHGVVVSCLCRAGRAEEAAAWLRRCREEGRSVNAVAYASAIDGLGKAGMADQAAELLEEMAAGGGGVRPDAVCYNAAMDALCRAGRAEEAAALLERMAADGCQRDAHTYTILMEGMFRGRKNEEALRLWGEMAEGGVAPTAAAARVLVKGLCMAGKVERACRALDELAPAGVVPEAAHEEMIGVLCRAGRVEQACRLADGIVERGREVPAKVRAVFINALRRAGRAELAMKLMHSKIGVGYDRLGSIKRRVKFQALLR